MFVIAGDQELYHFIDDTGTSPIGVRAACKYLSSITEVDIEQMIKILEPSVSHDEVRDKARLILEATGGHAGLSAYLSRRFVGVSATPAKLIELVNEFRMNHSHLFQTWHDHLTRPTRVFHDHLLLTKIVPISNVYAFFNRYEHEHLSETPPSFLKMTSIALQELVLTGIAVQSADEIKLVNRMYADYVLLSITATSGHPSELPVAYNLDKQREDIRQKATKIMSLVTEINESRRLKGQPQIFEVSNQIFGIYLDLCRIALDQDEFTHVISAFYRLIFELTAFKNQAGGKARSLASLPDAFRSKHSFVQSVDALRHFFGKGHVTDRSTWATAPNMMTEGQVLKKYLGTENIPTKAQYLELQNALLDDALIYLEQLKQDLGT